MKLPDIKTYWFTWLAIIVGLFLSKIIATLCGIKGIRAWVNFGYIPAIWIPIMILNYFEQQPLKLRLLELQRAGVGTSIVWWALLRILFAGETLYDPEVARLRERQIKFVKFVLFAALAFLPITALLHLL